MYTSLTQEDKDKLGKVGSGIRTSGCHLVAITEVVEVDENRVEAYFKTKGGETAKWTGWLESDEKGPDGKATGNKIPNQRTMNTLTFICNATGMKLNQVLSKTVNGTREQKSGSVPTVTFTALTGKELYITTSTLIEGDKKDAAKVYVKQDVDGFKFFDSKKRNAIEIASNAPEGLTMEAADLEAKDKIEVGYQFTGNDACQRKLAELQERAHGTSTTSTVGQIGSTPPVEENPDDI